jgi:transposase InsO family protein
MKGKSFSLDWMEEESVAFSNTTNQIELWHKRLRHFNQATLVHMQKKKMVQGMPNLEEEILVCTSCQYGKQNILSFPLNKVWRAIEKLQLIHTNVAGPLKTISLNGSRYYIAFIDDYTRMCWVYFLKFKTEVANVFLKFKNWIENQNGHKIQVVRSDNGTKYTSNKFARFCHDVGIEHRYTTPYTPQQNGVSELKNRTIMEMVRCLLFEKDLPKKFWAEAVNTVIFLLNRLPIKALQNKISYEAWHGYKPSLQNLKISGCLCFTYVPQVKKDNLIERLKLIFLSVISMLQKAIEFFNLKQKKVIVSKDIKFIETEKSNFKDVERSASKEIVQDLGDYVDEAPVRGTILLDDIYQSCNVAVLELAEFKEAKNNPKWIDAMKEELRMIEKNQTWKLVDIPKH